MPDDTCFYHDKLMKDIIKQGTILEEMIVPQTKEILTLLRGPTGMNGLIGRVEKIEGSIQTVLGLIQGNGTKEFPGLIIQLQEVNDRVSKIEDIKERGKGMLIGIALASGLGGAGICVAVLKGLAVLIGS